MDNGYLIRPIQSTAQPSNDTKDRSQRRAVRECTRHRCAHSPIKSIKRITESVLWLQQRSHHGHTGFHRVHLESIAMSHTEVLSSVSFGASSEPVSRRILFISPSPHFCQTKMKQMLDIECSPSRRTNPSAKPHVILAACKRSTLSILGRGASHTLAQDFLSGALIIFGSGSGIFPSLYGNCTDVKASIFSY